LIQSRIGVSACSAGVHAGALVMVEQAAHREQEQETAAHIQPSRSLDGDGARTILHL
jgi:hypothetical protein